MSHNQNSLENFLKRFVLRPGNATFQVTGAAASRSLWDALGKVLTIPTTQTLKNNADVLIIETTDSILKLDHIEPLALFLSTLPLSLSNKIVIFEDVHKIQLPIWNRLLKTLEDPPIPVFFFLLNPTSGLLPQTIRSRCQLLATERPGADQGSESVFEDFDPLAKTYQEISDYLKTLPNGEEILLEHCLVQELASHKNGQRKQELLDWIKIWPQRLAFHNSSVPRVIELATLWKKLAQNG